MVYSNSPIPSVETYRAEALTNFNSDLSQGIASLPKRIMVLGSSDIIALENISHLRDFKIFQYENPHFVIRSGIYQDFSLIATSDNLAESSFFDLRNLFVKRIENPILFLKIKDLLEMDSSTFHSNLEEFALEMKIFRTVKNTLRKDEMSADFIYQNQLNFRKSLEADLFDFLRNSVSKQQIKPEDTLKRAIQIIRSTGK